MTVDPMPAILDGELADEVYQERARRLAAMLAARPERLDMGSWTGHEPSNECGTRACVAGWSVIWNQGAVDIQSDGTMTWDPNGPALCVTYPRTSFERDGARFLGLDDTNASALFFSATDRDAVDVLRRLGSGELERTDVHHAVYHS